MRSCALVVNMFFLLLKFVVVSMVVDFDYVVVLLRL